MRTVEHRSSIFAKIKKKLKKGKDHRMRSGTPGASGEIPSSPKTREKKKEKTAAARREWGTDLKRTTSLTPHTHPVQQHFPAPTSRSPGLSLVGRHTRRGLGKGGRESTLQRIEGESEKHVSQHSPEESSATGRWVDEGGREKKAVTHLALPTSYLFSRRRPK